jgi:ATP synthase protein I
MFRAALRGAVTGSRATREWREMADRDMADKARDEHDPEHRPDDEAALSARLKRLDNRLGREWSGESPDAGRERSGVDYSGFSRGMRLSTELVGGIIVGAAIGWAVDRLLGTSPWGLSVGLLLGFAGGVANLVRASGNTGDRT